MQQITLRTRKKENTNVESSLPQRSKNTGPIRTFQYDNNFIVFLVPCILLVIVCGGGKYFLAIAVVGIVTAYIFEVLNLRTIALIVIWCTVGILYIVQLSFGIFRIRDSIAFLFMLMNNGVFIVLCGAWFTLHMPWLYSAELFVVVERVLFATFWIPSTATLTWAISTIYGLKHAPFYYLIFLCLSFYLYGLPRRSSLAISKRDKNTKTSPISTTNNNNNNNKMAASTLKDVSSSYSEMYQNQQDRILIAWISEEGRYICGRVDCAVHTFCLLFLPALLHIFISHKVIMKPSNLTTLGALLCIPIAFLKLLSHKDPLWWTGLSPIIKEKILSSVGYAAGLLTFLFLQMRVTLTPEFLSLLGWESSPVLGWFFVTLLLWSFVLLLLGYIFLHDTQFQDDISFPFLRRFLRKYSLIVTHFLSGIMALSFSVLTESPWYLLIINQIAVYFLVSFLFHKRLWEYFVFLGMSVITLIWLVNKTLWIFERHLPNVEFSFQIVALFIVLLLILSLMLPALVLTNKWLVFNSAVLFLHSALFVTIEEILFFQKNNIYPEYLVVVTSIIGIYLTLKIWSDFRINDTMSWIVVTLYISKSVLCLLPHKEFDDTEEDINRNVHRNPHDISEWYITLATFFLLLPITRLYYFLGDKAMNLKEGLFYIGWILIATIISRNVLISKIVLLIWNEEISSETILIAICGIVISVGMLPIAFRYLPQIMLLKTLNVFCLLMSCLFILLHQVWGISSQRTNQNWFTSLLYNVALLSALTLPVLIAIKLIKIQASVTVRILVGLAEGFLIGVLIPKILLEHTDSLSWIFQMALVFLCQLVSIFLLFSIWPSSHASEWLPKVYAAIWALGPILYFAEGGHTISSFEVTNSDQLMISGLYALINTLIALTLKLRTSTIPFFLTSQTLAVSTDHDSVTRRRLQLLKLQEQEKRTRTKFDFEWVPTVRNISTIGAIILWSVALSLYFSYGSEILIALMMLALLFLLHPQHKESLTTFPTTSRSPLFSNVFIVSIYLITTTLLSIFFAQSDVFLLKMFVIRSVQLISWRQKFAELILLCGILPSLYVMMKSKSKSRLVWLSVIPLNFFSLVLTQFHSIRLLALIGLIGTTLQHIIFVRKRRQSLRQL